MTRLRMLLRDRRGVTAIEFAIVLPVMLLMIMGLSDLAYREYVQVVFEGALQKAGRDSAIEGGDDIASDLDTRVMASVRTVAKSATYTATRTTNATFSQFKPERFTDTNGNGVRDAGECFDDVNGNGQWDQDPGASGQGRANDVTLYAMTITYPRLFPLMKSLGFPKMQTLSARTLLKNQPYASQVVTSQPTVTICT